jgi:predicted kinase
LDFWDLTVLIFRRWKIALPLLLLSISGTVFVALTAKPDYTMTAYVQFIPAKIAATDNPASASLRNPWNQLGMNTLGQAVIYTTQDQGFIDSLKAAHHTTNFTLTMTYPNPIITVEVVGTTPGDTRVTSNLILARLRAAAESLQRGSGVGDADIIAAQRLDQGQNLVPSTSKVKRAIMAVAAAGLILTAGGTVGLDAILRRRARKRAEAEAAAADGDGSPATTPEGAAAATNKAVAEPAVAGAKDSPGNGTVPIVPAQRGAPPESVERTAIIIKRTSSVVKQPAVKTETRRSPAATYRSANAHHQVNGGAANGGSGDEHATGADANGDASADSSDVRVVLQPKWVGGDNGGKAK